MCSCFEFGFCKSIGSRVDKSVIGGTLSPEILQIWLFILFLEYQISIYAKLEPAIAIIDSKTLKNSKMSGKYFWDTL